MENFFSLDGKFFRFINKFTSLIALNFLFIITSLPIITIGVSFYALYDFQWEFIEFDFWTY